MATAAGPQATQATTSGNVTQQGGAKTGREGAPGVGSPISNEAYNVIAALHASLEGLEAYRKYSRDCSAELWQRLTKLEIQEVSELLTELENLVKAGKLRVGEPGRGNA